MKNIELLAPAGNLKAGLAAINCGADAVYIGAQRFGAREGAANSLRDIESLCRHAHKYWARVYCALNTILTDAELTDARKLINSLYDAGIDGLIIQDVGLLELDRPPLPLIASTQMHNNTPEKVSFLERVGFSRVILARELNLQQIRDISHNTSIELEYFVHGSLCVCDSGQCYMSYALGGRSANRGRCAQPCRRIFALESADRKSILKQGYLLSLKDLNLSEHLDELATAGITSFKIEGRLKDAAYVTNVVAWYRLKIDRLLGGSHFQGSSSGKIFYDFIANPEKTFNRGFTTHFLKGRSKNLTSLHSPGFLGAPLGTIKATDGSSFLLSTRAELHSGDGISFFDRNNKLRGTHINAVRGRRIFPAKMTAIAPGIDVYQSLDHRFSKKLTNTRTRRLIAAALMLRETPDGFSAWARDEDGNEAAYALFSPKKLALNRDAARANTLKQLSKLGNTDFYCQDLDIEPVSMFFIPVSLLNALRRGVVQALTEQRERNRPIAAGGALRNSIPYPEKELTYLANVLNSRAEAFYRRHGVTHLDRAAESGMALKGKKLMTTKFCLRYQLDICKHHAGSSEAPQPLFLTDEDGRSFKLRFNCTDCVMEIYQM